MTLQRTLFSASLAIAATTLAVQTMGGLAPTVTARESTPARSQLLAQQLPFQLDGKPVYVQRNGNWQEAQLRGYSYNSRTGAIYTVQYVNDNRVEQNVAVSRIMSLAEAQKRGIAKAVYNLASQQGIQQMLGAHNTWRKRYGVPALTWSPKLAGYAQEWANKLLREGRLEHRQNSPYGENLAWAGGQQLSPERVVNMWGEEVKDYNYASNSCKPGKMCGHYTQVVWRKTTEVGCGMARGNGKEVWVCNYNPPGNYRGQKPY